MKFVSHSQAGQSAFAFHALGRKADGFFLDIGCSHPVELSNSYGLEEIGWRGLMLDSDRNAVDLCRATRRSRVLLADATDLDWSLFWMPKGVDFASVDIDEHTTTALRNLFEHEVFPSVICTEHDFYIRGERLRAPNRELLLKHGYDIVVKDVHHDGCCFEDWSVRPNKVDLSMYNKFRSEGLDWKAVLAQGGIEC